MWSRSLCRDADRDSGLDDPGLDRLREEAEEPAPAQQPDLLPVVAAERGESSIGRRPWEPVDERHERVGLDRKPAVRRGEEDTWRHPAQLGDESVLLGGTADVLDH